jgi:mannose-1-phosphate guanylyltransferase
MATSGKDRHRWAVLLAAGAGTRVQALTCDEQGRSVPKQFHSWDGTDSMLQWTLRRAGAVVPAERIVTIVARQHRRWWKEQLAHIPVENLLVQPSNKGTGAGILLPVLEIARRDPAAVVAVFPSDHFVANEARLRTAIDEAFQAVEEDPEQVVLIGIEPDEWENGYGWIIPSGPPRRIQKVDTFVEKPSRDHGMHLILQGALMNSFIFIGTASAIRDICLRSAPEVTRRLEGWQKSIRRHPEVLEAIYEDMPACDFSREVLEHSCSSLSVVRANGIDWSDLGTPERIERYRARHELCLQAV